MKQEKWRGGCVLNTNEEMDYACKTGGSINRLGDRSLPCAGIYGNKTANCVASESLTLRKNLSSVMSPVEVTFDIRPGLGVHVKMQTYRRKRKYWIVNGYQKWVREKKARTRTS